MLDALRGRLLVLADKDLAGRRWNAAGQFQVLLAGQPPGRPDRKDAGAQGSTATAPSEFEPPLHPAIPRTFRRRS
jgi:hypothetical protein